MTVKRDKSREVYDACRRYKYFYNKHEDVKSWDKKYHDIDLSDAVATTKLQLGLQENELMKALFYEMGVVCDKIDILNDIYEPPMSFGRFANARCVGSTARIDLRDSKRFCHVLSEYMVDMRKGYVRR